jgi:addiction module HigA family antidote
MKKTIEHPGIELGRRIHTSGMNMTQFAHSINVSPSRISELVGGKRSVTIDSACKIAKAFKTTPELWLSKQIEYDLAQNLEEKECIRRPSWMTL